MPPTTRARAVATLEEGQAKLDALLARLPDAAIERPGTIGGGDWSAKDLIGHVAFWEELAVDLLAAQRDGRRPRAADVFGGPGGIDAANAADQARSAAMPLRDVRQRAAAAHAALLEGIRALGDAEWSAQPTYPIDRPRPLGDLLGGVTGAPDRAFGHAWAHLGDLEAYVEGAAPG